MSEGFGGAPAFDEYSEAARPDSSFEGATTRFWGDPVGTPKTIIRLCSECGSGITTPGAKLCVVCSGRRNSQVRWKRDAVIDQDRIAERRVMVETLGMERVDMGSLEAFKALIFQKAREVRE